jgi:hypothetical protein
MPDAPFENDSPVAAAHVVCDLSRIAFVVHEQELELADVRYKELLEAVGEAVAGLLVATVTDLREEKISQVRRTV